MGLRTYIAAGATALFLALGVTTFLLGRAYLAERDTTAKLEQAAEINKLTQQLKDQQQQALTIVRETYDGQISAADRRHTQEINDVTRQLVDARRAAVQEPIHFGDDLMRGFLRVDCVWSLGAEALSPEGRASCDRQAATSDPARAGFSVLTPSFLRAWSDACEQYPRAAAGSAAGETGDLAYTLEEWAIEFGNFDPSLCSESLVVMTPEAALYFRLFLENGSRYTLDLLRYVSEQNEVLDLLQRKGPTPN